MPTVFVKINTHGLDGKLEAKGSEIEGRLQRFKTSILNMAVRIIQRRAPRGKTGRLKASVMKDAFGVFVSKAIAAYRDFVIDGRRGFCRKGNTYLGSDIGNPRFLKFQIYGKTFFRRCVGPAKSQPFVDESFPEIVGNVELQIKDLENWFVEL